MSRVLVAAVVLCAIPGSAPAASAEVIEDVIDVLEVQVPVNVLGSDGRPVRGLEAGDFEILDGGEEREIVAFREIDLETLQPTPGRIDEDQFLPASARRHVLLLFDLSFSRPRSVLEARRAAQEFVLESFHPTDLAAVMTFSLERGLRLLVTFTSDRAQLARAIDTMGLADVLDERSQDPLRFMIDSPANAERLAAGEETGAISVGSPSAGRGHLSSAVIGREIDRQAQSAQRGRVAAWVDTLGSLADLLSGVAGRKHVVYFSNGFDSRILMGEGGVQERERSRLDVELRRTTFVDAYERYGDIALMSQLMRVLEDLGKSDALVESVDISTFGGSTRGRNGDILRLMALRTGGRAVTATDELAADLEAVLDRSAVTYLLTFQAEGAEADGSYHPIEVRAAAPKGAKLSHRPGYYAPRPFGELHALEKSLLTADAIAAAAPRREVGLEVLAAPFKSRPGRAYVPVILEIDGPSLLVGHDQANLPVEIYVYASDAEGGMKDYFTQVVALDVERGRDALERGGLKYYGHLDLPHGEHLVRILVRNGVTGRSGVSASRVAVPGFASTEPALVGPFFPEPPGSWVLVREKSRVEAETVVYPFTVGGEVYVPAARPELVSSGRSRLCLVGYNLGSGPLQLEGTVLTEDGDALEGGTLGLEERTVTGIVGYDKLLLSFHPGNLEPGDYRLRITLGEEGSPLVATAAAPITVVE